MATPEEIENTAERILRYMLFSSGGSRPRREIMGYLKQELTALIQPPPTPAGSGSDSDMYPGASSSQSREPGVEPRQGKGDP